MIKTQPMFIGDPTFEAHIKQARDNGQKWVRLVVRRGCLFCGSEGGMTQDGIFGTGIPLDDGYRPVPGELIKNHSMTCDACGDAQYS